jgi:hypothetical protein
MPHFKCVTCRTRISTVGEVTALCEGCGSRFEPAGRIGDLVGYRLAQFAVEARPPRDAEPRADEGFAAAVAAALRTPETHR